MFAGIDLGTTLIKMVQGTEKRIVDFAINPYGFSGQDLFEDDNAQKFASALLKSNISAICLTGSQAARFTPIAIKHGLAVHETGLDSIENELHLQALGVRQLLAEQGHAPDDFLLVSIGTGTSFTLVTRGGSPRQFTPGLSVGGRTLSRLALIKDVQAHRIGGLAMYGNDPDLLMMHLYPDAGMFKGQFVLASMGRLGNDEEPQTLENYCHGLIKMIATLTIGHIMTIKQVPDFQWDGPVVYIGTPVSEYKLLQNLFLKFSAATGMTALMPKQGNFAAAMGAYSILMVAKDQGFRLAQVTPWTSLKARISYYTQLVKAMAS